MTPDTTFAIWVLVVCAVLYLTRGVITRDWRI